MIKFDAKRVLTECCFYHTDLGCGGVESRESTPVVNDETGTNDVGSTIYGTSLETNKFRKSMYFPRRCWYEPLKALVASYSARLDPECSSSGAQVRPDS